MSNYFCYHIHSDLSNGVTNIDSVTKFDEYIAKAKECGMTTFGFTEHGSVFEWFHKKDAIEKAGMKYVHAVEAYITESLDERVRDNMHCVLIARNYAGFLELNRLVSNSFNRKDNHFYYVPRISFEELTSVSENIIITSACVGGILGKGGEKLQDDFLRYMQAHKDRCFLEIGHHKDQKQLSYNEKLYELHKSTGIRLIAGTDTHVLNERHEKGRSILQKSKRIFFEGEENWDLKFKTYDELVEAYRQQGSLPQEVYLAAIEETNVLADMIEPFSLDFGTKYPRIGTDYENPEETFYKMIKEAEENHPYALKNHTRDELDRVIEEEFEVYKATKSIDFMLLQTYLRQWEKIHGIQCGYSRGSVSGSMIAYLLGITEMDSIKFGLNFFRFMNPDRVTNADIDSDYSGVDRDKVKQFLLRDKMCIPTIKSAEIITFNTIALKGAIRDVGRALEMDLNEVSDICSKCEDGVVPSDLRKKYSKLFDYVDIVNGTIVSVGTHPSGVLISDLPIKETVGLCSISSSDYPVSMLNMKELDALMYVKLDILGLDNIGVVNDTCKMLGIDRLTPDNTDLEDEKVWKSIIDDTTLIFQWESNSAQHFLKKFMSEKTLEIAKSKIKNFSMIKWLSFGNGLIRPACASFRDSVARGEFYDNGFDELNDFLAMEAGRIAMQETIMQFLVKFCGYSNAESDTVRRAIAKKKGTEQLLPEIEGRFVDYSSEHYDITKERCEEVIKPFIQVIMDASDYAFSWNHSDSYSLLGYICGYLRYYYPYEFLTAALNIFSDNASKTAEITKYAAKRGIRVSMPKWGVSRSTYAFDKDNKVIAKNLTSIKYMSAGLAEELYQVAHSRRFKRFMDVLDALESTSINTRQLDILIKLDFFSDFGNQRELLKITEIYVELFKRGSAKQIFKTKIEGTPLEPIVEKYAVGITKSGVSSKSYTLLDVKSILYEAEDAVMAIKMPDLDDITKVKNFYDIMGYIGYISDKEDDKHKLYVMDVRPLQRRKDKRIFGYAVDTKSIGNGKESSVTIYNKNYERQPIKKGDIILFINGHGKRPYYILDAYKKIG